MSTVDYDALKFEGKDFIHIPFMMVGQCRLTL